MRIIGYAYDADMHCIACTSKAIDSNVLKIVHIAVNDNLKPPFHYTMAYVDREGNRIHAIFDIDEHPDSGEPRCGDCFDLLD